MDAEPPAVRVDHLTKAFRVPSLRKRGLAVLAVNDLSLQVAPGEIYGLIGPNGSGKSTTMKILLGLISPTKGTTSIFGIDSREVSSRADVGFLPENPYFYKNLTGLETLHFYGKLAGLPRSRRADKGRELLEFVGLETAGDRRLSGYSKGMLQRIGLAQALIQNPRLVVLDEPTAGVDPRGSRMIRDLIFSLKERGISVILSSHLLEQVQEVCDRIGIIFRGDLVKEGSVDELIAIENQTEVVLENADPALQEKIRNLVEKEGGGAELIRVGHPRTTLERLFLEETMTEKKKEGSS